MDELYRITAALEAAYDGHGQPPLLVCLTSALEPPASCVPMPRLPVPQLGAALDENFGQDYRKALHLNAEIHDGAIIAGRSSSSEKYRVIGWSFRLFPPAFRGASLPNRGSAFHSALAMSAEADVDAVILLARGEAAVFLKGRIARLTPLAP